MDVLGVRVLLAPGASAAAVAWIAAGVALGTLSGLVPGLHVNTLALLLAATAADLPGPPRLVGAAVLAAGVVHSFLDAVPALALGVPDPAAAATALPGHRLVLAGRGREAVRLAALGSAGAVALAAPLAPLVTWVMVRLYPMLVDHLSLVLGAVAALLVVAERTWVARAGGLLALGASGALGLVALDAGYGGLTGDPLAPLFAGLFGAPVLLRAARGSGIPEQDDATVLTSRRGVGAAALAGTLGGAAVGYVPGVSGAVAAVGALAALPRAGDRAYVVATSGTDTANAVFALFALVALGSPRTGVLVALERAGSPLNLPLLLGAVVVAAAAGAALVLTVGDRYLAFVAARDPARLSAAVVAGLVGFALLLAGPRGLLAFLVAAAIGLLPARLGARRVHLMGVLIVPIAL
jgi:putative membrane protein